MSQLSRRSFLRYCGAGVSTLAAGCLLPYSEDQNAKKPVLLFASKDQFPLDWADLPYPVLLPGDRRNHPHRELTVTDDLLVPEGFAFSVIAKWGDRFGPPGKQIRVGNNSDFVQMVPVDGHEGEYWLVINHEYVSIRPWAQAFAQEFGHPFPDIFVLPETAPGAAGKGVLSICGVRWKSLEIDLSNQEVRKTLPEKAFSELEKLSRYILEEVGVSILRVKRSAEGLYEVISESPHHKRITAVSTRNLASGAGISINGPAARFLSSPPGTLANCAGGLTPWGTVLTCEENFQDFVIDGIDASGNSLPASSAPFAASMVHPGFSQPLSWEGLHQASQMPLDGRGFGWVCEIFPETGELRKLSALGRFRHENAAVFVEPGMPLFVYMGDDRRGGHIWRFRSTDLVEDPRDPENSKLFESGELAVARFEKNFSGRWIPLLPDTPLQVPRPETCATGNMSLPKRPDGGYETVSAPGSKYKGISAKEWVNSVSNFAGKPFSELRLKDLLRVPSNIVPGERKTFLQAVLNMDAFLMGNAIGGTPTARPEGIDIHPFDRSIYIAFTDSTGRGEGSPDRNIFPDSLGENSRQYGAIFRIEENRSGDFGNFRWGRFVSSGETAEAGGGFAAADNIRFDKSGNLWMVCDIAAEALQHEVTREKGTKPGDKNFAGIFGNNAVFLIPTSGPNAGVPRCFAIGPMECELTGHFWSDDGKSLILSVQHPGEFHGIRGRAGSELQSEEMRSFLLRKSDGSLMTQTRNIPLGSNFPSGKIGEIPRSSVVQIYRKEG